MIKNGSKSAVYTQVNEHLRDIFYQNYTKKTKLRIVRCCVLLLIPLVSQAYRINEVTKEAGNIGQIVVPTEALTISLLKHDKEGCYQFLLSFGGTLAMTQTLKYLVDEERPNHKSSGSFPSGHTAWAFSGATYLHRRYGLPYAIPAYFYASGVAFTRVKSHRHYWHDVIAGAGVAAFNTIIFTKPFKKVPLDLSLGINEQNTVAIKAAIDIPVFHPTKSDK